MHKSLIYSSQHTHLFAVTKMFVSPLDILMKGFPDTLPHVDLTH